MNFKRKNQSAFTLAESMISVVVLSIAAMGVLLPFTSGMVIRSDGENRTLAAELASNLMEQIVNTPYNNILTAYNGYSEPRGQVKKYDGTVFTDSRYSPFSRQVSCQRVNVPQQSQINIEGNINGETGYILVNIKVYYNDKLYAELNRLRSK